MVNRGWLYADSGACAYEERAPAQGLRALPASVRVAQEVGAGLGAGQVLLRGVSTWHPPRRAGPAGPYLTALGRPGPADDLRFYLLRAGWRGPWRGFGCIVINPPPPWRSLSELQHCSGVDLELAAGHVARLVGGQEAHDRRDVFGLDVGHRHGLHQREDRQCVFARGVF